MDKNMKLILYIATCFLLFTSCEKSDKYEGPIFDTHLHHATELDKQFEDLEKYNIVKGAVSSSWDNLDKYRSKTGFLIGLMLPCPNGIVPYSGQKCFFSSQSVLQGTLRKHYKIIKRLNIAASSSRDTAKK
jgi:hypothetical protein